MVNQELSKNIFFNSIIEKKFKTNAIIMKCIMPLDRNIVSTNAMISYLLRMCSKKYRPITNLNKRLNELYGANLFVDVDKVGAYQILKFVIIFIDDFYTINNEEIVEDCCNLLLSIFSDPYFENGIFCEKDIQIAKSSLINKINSRINNKINYSIDKCMEYMFESTPIAINEYGYKEDVENISSKIITEGYKKMLDSSLINITYVGSSGEQRVFEVFKNYFSNMQRNNNINISFKVPSIKEEVLYKNEYLKVSQANLIIGLKIKEISINAENARCIMIMNGILGASPYSKLFINVREQMNLCYRCFSQYDKFNHIILIGMGIQQENRDKAFDESLKQLREVQEGNFGVEDIDNIKYMYKNFLLGIKDSNIELGEWYFNQGLLESDISIDESISLMEQISKDEIVNVANCLVLDTIYFMGGDENIDM